MLFASVAALALAAVAAAKPVPNPIEVIKRAPNPRGVSRRCTQPGVLALAYDVGPHTYTQQLVEMLNKAGVKGTFFWTGTLYGCIYKQPAAIKAASAGGHQVASHTWYDFFFGSMLLASCG